MNRSVFYDAVRASLFAGKLSTSQVEGMEAILDAFQPYELSQEEMAYMLATAFHETARTMQPIEEYGKGKGHSYGAPAGPFKKIYDGRGYVQLTWYENYKKAQDKLGVPFVQYPEKALEPKHAADIMIKGMLEGWFTGKKLSDYFNASTTDWINARRIINGTDRAADIAGYAKHFLAALKAAGSGEVVAPVPTPTPEPKPPLDYPVEPPAAPAPADDGNWLVSLLKALAQLFHGRK